MNNWIPLIIFLASSIGALQVWILLQIYNIHGKISSFETQMGRIISDIESEKDTRKRLHEDFDHRIRTLERSHA